jgi:hypothetical protein
MSEPSTTSQPALPTFLPRGIPVAPFSMQKVLTKAIRSHGSNQNLHNFKTKDADKMGGKRGSSRGGRGAKVGKSAGKTATVAKTK